MTTPMMQQWFSCKGKARDALLLFRLGDFYEAFYEDAVTIARDADLTLTKRQSVPMAGIPYHAAATYIDRLVAKGHKIAIAEQLEEAGRGLVRRDIVRTITPGTQLQSSLLLEDQNNFIACYVPGAVAFLDLTTANFSVAESCQSEEMAALFCKFQPSEIVYANRHADEELFAICRQSFKVTFSAYDDWVFDRQAAEHRLKEHFKVMSLDGLGFKDHPHAARAAGSLLLYLSDFLLLPLTHIHKVTFYTSGDYLFLDRTTKRNLELIDALHEGDRAHTLLHVLDETETPMGARELKVWLQTPLGKKKAILERQEAIAELLVKPLSLASIRDIERLTMRITTGCATPRDMVALKNSLQHLPALTKLLNKHESSLLRNLAETIGNFTPLTDTLGRALVEEPPLKVGDGPLFKTGYAKALDELYAFTEKGKTWLVDYQAQLREETGIKSLKVGYTAAFGYFIDVSTAQSTKVPSHFHKRQTLVNNERYVSHELKEFEQKALTAREEIEQLECKLLEELREVVKERSSALFKTASAVATLDCLSSLAKVAARYNYTRPTIVDDYALSIHEGRHPVIEQTLQSGTFSSNSLDLHKKRHLLVLTGPNMGGKSTYIRQIALITLMAHMGSFVPASEAQIPLIDKIFTRIGASDDLSRGQSTFMVEMTETAHILNMATERSLVILDEIGRGTSTFDGISIAWSVAEYLLTEIKAKTLFATHYFELTKLPDRHKEAANCHVAVQESQGSLLFLHRILPGPAAKSFGIQVAELAGLPERVITRAKEIQRELSSPSAKTASLKPTKPHLYQTELALFD